MKRGHTAGILKVVGTLALCGACAACADVLPQRSSSSDSASLGNRVQEGIPSTVGGEALEQRNRDIVQSVTGRAM
jgi:hypothetical protein